MSALVGIELGGYVWKVAYTIEATISASPSPCIFDTSLTFQGINLNAFTHLVGRDPSDPSLAEIMNPREVLSTSGASLIGLGTPAQIGLKMFIGDRPKACFVPSTLILALLFRNVLQAVVSSTAVLQSTAQPSIQAVVVVPHWFDQPRKDAIVKSALLAGFSRVGVLNYINASISCYKTLPSSSSQQSQQNVLVVDIGHNTTCVTLVTDTSQGSTIQSTEFNDDLGGRDIDRALASQLGNRIVIDRSSDLTAVRSAFVALMQEAEKAKRTVQPNRNFEIEVHFAGLGSDFQAVVTWEMLVDTTRPITDQIFKLVQNALLEAELSYGDVDVIVMHGPTAKLLKPFIIARLPVASCVDLPSSSVAKYAVEVASTIPPGVDHLAWIGRGPVGGSVAWRELHLNRESGDRGSSTDECSGTLGISPVSTPTAREVGVSTSISTNTSIPDYFPTSNPTSASHKQARGDIERLSSLVRQASPNDLQYADLCNDLCAAYLEEYSMNGDILALNHATLWVGTALGDTDFQKAQRPGHLANLATCLHKHYKNSGVLDQLNMAILYYGYIVDSFAADASSSEVAAYLINHGALLQTRGEHLGHIPDLEMGGKHIQRAIDILIRNPANVDVERLDMALNNLGNILQVLYRWTGKIQDLHRMITVYEIALSFSKEPGLRRAANLNSCGSAMMHHHNHFGDVEDVKKAIQYFTEALEHIPDNHPSKPSYLGQYSSALQAMYIASDDTSTIALAIKMNERALALVPDGQPQKAIFFNKSGALFANRFRLTKDPKDLEEAIRSHEKAIELTEDHRLMQRALFLSNLSASLEARYRALDTIEDLERSISLLEKATTLLDDGSDKGRILYNLAASYFDLYYANQEEKDRRKCMSLCKEVVGSLAPLNVRFQAAKTWTDATTASKNGAEALEATSTMVDLLAQLAWPGLSLASQINVLKVARQNACDTAAIALHYKDVGRALEWLEQGRTIAWNQLLQIRSPLTDLKEIAPALAEEIIRLSQMLERGGRSMADTDELTPRLMVEKAPEFTRNAIALKRDNLVKQARALPGFERLMTSKEYIDFAVTPFEGPVVVINASRFRCDAIILQTDRLPSHVPLTDFSLDQAETLRDMMMQALKDSASSQRGSDDSEASDADERFGRPRKPRADPEAIDAKFRYILKQLFTKVVLPLMASLGIDVALPGDTCMPRIWWCPTGPLTFLPFHAAGIYAADDDHETARITLLDYAISSYTPSLSALHNIVYHKSQRPAFTMLSVIQPNTPGHCRLPATLEELSIIRKHTAGFVGRVEVLEGSQATTEAVMGAMKSASWIHLACHGEQNVNEPTKSGLHLHDGTLGLQDIIQEQLPNADFAFLSACQTASGDVAHPDEAIHLAAGMLLAGYNSVIATMWSIGDKDAAMVADDVYGYLFCDGKAPDSKQAARALHNAVLNLKAKHAGPHGGTRFAAWLPYIHVGM